MTSSFSLLTFIIVFSLCSAALDGVQFDDNTYDVGSGDFNYSDDTFFDQDPADQPMTLAFLNDPAFKRKITGINMENRKVDIDCRKSKGTFWYVSYAGHCENCVVRCSNPTEGMMDECLDKCQHYAMHQVYMRKINESENRNQKLDSELISTKKEFRRLEAYVNRIVYTFSFVAAGLFLIITAVASCFYIHVKKNYAKRPPNKANPEGDAEEMKIFNQQPTDLGYESVTT